MRPINFFLQNIVFLLMYEIYLKAKDIQNVSKIWKHHLTKDF